MVKGSVLEPGSYLGANIVPITDLNLEEQKLVTIIANCLKEDADPNLLIAQRLTVKYYTLVYETWYNDFIRFKYTNGEYLFLLKMYPDMRKAYRNDEIFSVQEQKNKVFWQAEILDSKDVLRLKDAIIESCLSFEKFNPKYYEG